MFTTLMSDAAVDIDDVLDKLFEGMGFAMLYTLVALVLAGALIAFIMYKVRPERLQDFKKVCAGFIAGFAIIAMVLMTYVTFYQINLGGGSPKELFEPILSLVVIALAGGCLMGVASFFNKFLVKVAAGITAAGLTAAFIATMVMLTRYYNNNIVGDEYYSPYFNEVGIIVSAVLAIAVLVLIFFLGKKREVDNTRAVVYGAIAIAMSFALSYARLVKLPQGGSITFASLLPLMIYCCMFGTRRGLMVCIIYGFLQAVQDTYIIHPLQFLLDYPLAFGMIGISGIFFERTKLKNHKLVAFVLGAIIAVVLRYICHICSGTFAFGAYAVDSGFADRFFYYSLAYNSFTIVDLAIDIAAGVLLFASKAFTRQMEISAQPRTGAADEIIINEEE